jgi:hypothetical protein
MKEHAWLVQRLADRHGLPVTDPVTASQDVEEEVVEEEGEEIECGCCFSSYPFVSISGR